MSNSPKPDLPDVEYISLEDKPSKTIKTDSSQSSSPEPSHKMTGEYAALMETNGNECESWYYFIRRQGNEEALQHLQDQLEKVNHWIVLDDLSAFDLDLDHFVTAKTAKQMTKIELNSYAFHRKFDGKLQMINLGFRKKDKDEKKMCKTFDQLGYGQIEDYISDEDLDPEDLTDNESSDSDEDEERDTENESTDSESDEDSGNSAPKKHRPNGIPPALLKSNIPRWAKAKRRQHR